VATSAGPSRKPPSFLANTWSIKTFHAKHWLTHAAITDCVQLLP
jgi:hypothetical protein